MKKLLSILTSLAVATGLPLIAAAATLSTPLTVSTNYPSLGSTINVSGSCGSPGANSSVSFSLVQSGITTPLASGNNLSTSPSGSFSGNVTLPSSFPAGPATLVATCTASGDILNSSTITFPAPTSTSVNVGTANPNTGGVINLNGACGASGGAGTASLSLNVGGATTQLGTVNLSSTGTFNTNLVIPTSAGSGTGTLTATCSNGTTFSSSVTLNPIAVSSFSANSTATLGTGILVSGNCGSAGANASGTATFSLLRNGTLTPVSASGGANVNGNFSSTVNLPLNFGGGAATLVVNCPSGSTFTSQLSLIDPSTGLLTVPPGTTPTATPAVGGGVTAGATPVGAVKAGMASTESGAAAIEILLVLAGLSGIIALRKLIRS